MNSRTLPADLQPLRTADGSFTLRNGALDATYHSVHGAVLESTHVFIRAGLEAMMAPHVRVLEVGLGTGLNLLLTWIRCVEGKMTVDYTALEPHPLERAQLEQLAHCSDLGWPGLHEPFLELMTGPVGSALTTPDGFAFTRLAEPLQQFSATDGFDVIYFDAFAPTTQPELWTPEVFNSMYRALAPGGRMVTYCAKGAVRRAMQEAGFTVERLTGPPGKREMLRATKPQKEIATGRGGT